MTESPLPGRPGITYEATSGRKTVRSVTFIERLVWPCLEMVDDAVGYLCAKGHLDPEEDPPDYVVAELIEIAKEGDCGEFCVWPSGSSVAEHYLYRKQHEYEESLPVWLCLCGTPYKVLVEWGHQESFYELGDDGWLGDHAGAIRRGSKGQVKHSDKCKNCGREYATTIDRQLDPQQFLFEPEDVLAHHHEEERPCTTNAL